MKLDGAFSVVMSPFGVMSSAAKHLVLSRDYANLVAGAIFALSS